jgi:hypothetical protein
MMTNMKPRAYGIEGRKNVSDELFALPLQAELPHYVTDAHGETVAICDNIEQAKYFAATPDLLEKLERENDDMRQLILALAASEPCTNHGLLLRKRANAMIARFSGDK